MIKRGVSAQADIVSTILLVLLSIVLVGLVIGFVVPFVKEKLSSGDCLEVLGKIEIKPDYTYYANNQMYVQIHIADASQLINGLAISLGGADSKNFRIINGSTLSDVKMYNGNSDLELPNNNEERTYNITSSVKPTSVSVYPILKNNKICEVSDTITDF